MENVEVEIIIVAYNAEKYIQQAIDSVLLQKTDFRFHIHVYDDCSTDNTASLVSHYKNKNCTLHASQFNLGTFENLQKAIVNCKSPFVALLEGDDYWNNVNKLQVQIDFLKSNPNYAGCAGNSLTYDQANCSFAGLYNPILKTEYELPELFSVPPFQIGTLVYHRKFLPTIPNEFKNTISNDKVVYTLLAQYGNIYCINEPMAVYRKHSESISNSEKSRIIYAKHQLLYSKMKQHFGRKYYKFIEDALFFHLKGHMIALIKKNESIKSMFPQYLFYWIKLKKWLTLDGYKDMYYFSRKIF